MTARDVLETNIDPAVPDGGQSSIDSFANEVLAPVHGWLAEWGDQIPAAARWALYRIVGFPLSVEGEKSSRPADATPDSAREQRLAQLLDTIRTYRGEWRAGDVVVVRRMTGGPIQRSVARRDLAELHRRGHLNQHGAADGRFYTLKRKRTRGGDER